MGLSCCKAQMAGGPNWNRKGYKQANTVAYISRMRQEKPEWKEEEAMVAYVTILNCQELKSMKNFSGFSGPYVECSLSPADPAAGAQKQRTSFQPNTANPKWTPGERLQFLFTSRNETMKIKFNTYCFNLALAPEPLGDAIIYVKNIHIGDNAENTVKLTDPATGNQLGTITYHIEVITVKAALAKREDVVYEFERFQPGALQWGHTRPGHFLVGDPGRYCSFQGKNWGDDIDSIVETPPGWTVTVPWHCVATEEDPDGWQYSTDFMAITWHNVEKPRMCVRRRAHVREICAPAAPYSEESSESKAADTRNPIASV